MPPDSPPSDPMPSLALNEAVGRDFAPREAVTVSAEELAAILDVTLRLGTLIATAGAAAFRVRETMLRTARSFGVTRVEVTYDLDALHTTLYAGALRQTEVVRVPTLGVDMTRICRIALLARELDAAPGRLTTAELSRHLDVIGSAPSPYPMALTPWLLGASGAAFCGVIGGSPWQMVAAFAGTFVGHCLRLYHHRTHPPVATIVVTCAFTSALVSWASARGLALGLAASGFEALALGAGPEALGPGKAVLASVLYLIPGVPLVNGLIDLLHFDFAAGLARSAYATVVVVCIAVGVLTFLSLTGFALT